MTLIHIVGDDISRIVPVLYAFREEAKEHILFCDDDPANHARAKRLKAGMERFSSNASLHWQVEIVTTNEDIKEQIEVSAEEALAQDREIWLNATDGYPAMTLLLADMIRQRGGRVISYDHFDNDLHTIYPDGTMETVALESKIDLESYLVLLDYRIVDAANAEDLRNHKDEIMALYRDPGAFKKVRGMILARHFNLPGAPKQIMDNRITALLRKMGVLDAHNRLIASQQKVLQGDILEAYAFWLCESLNPDDIKLGVKIDFDEPDREPLSQRRVLNEFDILMTHNNRIYTVECKLSEKLDGLEFVYKYDAIIDYFGKTAKAIILNISSKPKKPYMGTKTSSNFRHSTLRRARLAGVAVYHESVINPVRFQNLVRNFFGIG